MEVGLLDARSVVPCHHDDWLPGFSTASDVGVIRSAIAKAGLGTVVHELDYRSVHPLFPEGSAAAPG